MSGAAWVLLAPGGRCRLAFKTWGRAGLGQASGLSSRMTAALSPPCRTSNAFLSPLELSSCPAAAIQSVGRARHRQAAMSGSSRSRQSTPAYPGDHPLLPCKHTALGIQ